MGECLGSEFFIQINGKLIDLNGPQTIENCLVIFGGLPKVGMLWSGRTLNLYENLSAINE